MLAFGLAIMQVSVQQIEMEATIKSRFVIFIKGGLSRFSRKPSFAEVYLDHFVEIIKILVGLVLKEV